MYLHLLRHGRCCEARSRQRKPATANSSAPIASGGVPPYTYSTSGTLPPGLTLTSRSGAITGTPTAAGTFNFTV